MLSPLLSSLVMVHAVSALGPPVESASPFTVAGSGEIRLVAGGIGIVRKDSEGLLELAAWPLPDGRTIDVVLRRFEVMTDSAIAVRDGKVDPGLLAAPSPAAIGTENGTFTSCARAVADRLSTPRPAKPVEEEPLDPVALPACHVLLVSEVLEFALRVPGCAPEYDW
jgi:hypothetical protein